MIKKPRVINFILIKLSIINYKETQRYKFILIKLSIINYKLKLEEGKLCSLLNID